MAESTEEEEEEEQEESEEEQQSPAKRSRGAKPEVETEETEEEESTPRRGRSAARSSQKGVVNGTPAVNEKKSASPVKEVSLSRFLGDIFSDYSVLNSIPFFKCVPSNIHPDKR